MIGIYLSLVTVIFAFYGKFPISMRMSPYSTHEVRLVFLQALFRKRNLDYTATW